MRCDTAASTLAVARAAKDPQVVKGLWSAAAQGRHPSRCCPACEQTMQAVECTSTDNNIVEVDVCTSCQFIWFDAGELARLPPPKHLSPEAEQLVHKLEADLERDQPRTSVAIADALRRPVSGDALLKAFFAGNLISAVIDVLEAVFEPESCP
jgi:Zn-finger nucleic acid-binding protein